MRPLPMAFFAVFMIVVASSSRAQTGAELHWLKQPSSEDIAAVYPRKAARLGHYGRVTLNCSVQPDGGLARCEVLAEDPADEGFADVALKLSKLYKMASPDGSPLPPTTVEVPIRFSLAP